MGTKHESISTRYRRYQHQKKPFLRKVIMSRYRYDIDEKRHSYLTCQAVKREPISTRYHRYRHKKEITNEEVDIDRKSHSYLSRHAVVREQIMNQYRYDILSCMSISSISYLHRVLDITHREHDLSKPFFVCFEWHKQFFSYIIWRLSSLSVTGLYLGRGFCKKPGKHWN
jgi:hypothetical protein